VLSQKIFKGTKEGKKIFGHNSKKVQENEEKSHVPKEIQQLLDEFARIVVNDMPMGMPPMRSISHHIDLIPRSTLPNKAPYLMTHVERKEVNRQVQGIT
jgi:hypothetical protein